MTDPLEGYDDLNEYEQSILEQELLSRAFRNSYNLITERKTINDIVQSTGGLLIAHDPSKDLKTPELLNMMDYFVETEEYEKCSEIRDLIKKIKTNVRKQEKNASKEFNKILNNTLRGTKKGKDTDSKSSI